MENANPKNWKMKVTAEISDAGRPQSETLYGASVEVEFGDVFLTAESCVVFTVNDIQNDSRPTAYESIDGANDDADLPSIKKQLLSDMTESLSKKSASVQKAHEDFLQENFGLVEDAVEKAFNDLVD